MTDSMIKIGQIFDVSFQSRDYPHISLKFEVIDIDADYIICEFTSDLPYRVGYDDNMMNIIWLDPSGGPMMSIGTYQLCNMALNEIYFSVNSTIFKFKK